MKRLLLSITALLAIAWNGHAQTLIAHYDFNGNTAESINSLNGTAVGAPVYVPGSTVTGSQAIKLASGDYVMVPFDTLLNLTSWTISAIVKFSNFGGTTSTIVERYDGARYGPDYMSVEVYHNLLAGSAAFPRSGTSSVGTPTLIKDTTQFHCITVSYDATTDTIKTYYDGGAMVNSNKWGSNGAYSFPGAPILYIGSNTPGYGIVGAIDDIQIYKGVLNPAQVLTACTKVPTPPIASSCSDSCYWKVTGNSIIGGNNILGTTSPDPIRIYTSNRPVATYTADGNYDLGAGSVINGGTSVTSVLGMSNTATNATANSHIGGHDNTIDHSYNNTITGAYNTIRHGTVSSAIFGGTIGPRSSIIDSSFSSVAVGVNHFIDTSHEIFTAGAGNIISRSGQSGVFGEGNRLTASGFAGLFGGGNRMSSSSSSFATGSGNNMTSSSSSFVTGSANQMTSSGGSFSSGAQNSTTNSNYAVAFGSSNQLNNSSTASQALGQSNVISNSTMSLASGMQESISNSQYSSAFGSNNNIGSSQNSHAVGAQNNINNATGSVSLGTSNSIAAQDNAFAAGAYNVITNTSGNNGTSNSSLGQDNRIQNSIASGLIGIGNNVSGGMGSIALGSSVTAQGSKTHAYGDLIANTLPGSIAMGFGGTRTMTVTQTGVGIAVSNATNYAPTHHLETDAAVSGNPAASNIAFYNLPLATAPVSSVVVNRATGELFYQPISSTPTAYTSNQGVSLTGTSFSLGDACNGGTSTPFFSDRQINFGSNYKLYFNTSDNGKVFFGNTACQSLATRVEISSNGLTGAVNSYTPAGAPSTSGLRFTNMKPATTQLLPNQKNGVLSLDDDGDVIWVQAAIGGSGSTPANNGCSVSGGNVQLGEDCNNPAVPGAANLTSDRAVPLNDYNLVFRDGSFSKPGQAYNRIGIGTSCAPSAKLEVVRNMEPMQYDGLNRAISGTNNDAAPPINPMTGTSGEATGIYGEANNQVNRINRGGDFLGINAQDQTYGVRGIAQTNGREAYGGWFSACGAQARNVGVYGEVCGGNDGPSDWAGFFNGNTYCPAGVWTSSDKRIKQHVEPIGNALSLIDRIQPKKYQYDAAAFPGLNLPAHVDNYGVIAQELETVLPTLVKEAPVPDANKKGFTGETIKTVNYTQLIPILIQAVKEQQTEIEQLREEKAAYKSALDEKLALLEQSIANICENGCPGLTKANVKDDAGTAHDMLYQSVPNPTNNKAVISYVLGHEYSNAVITIADMNGKLFQTIPLKPVAGSGSISVELGEYAAQTYVYTLLINGKAADSKRMVVVK